MSAHQDPWPWHFTPWHWVADGRDSDDVCSKCLQRCEEESIEAVEGADGVMYYCCEACAEELKRDFIED